LLIGGCGREFEARSDAFLRSTQHPTLGRSYLQTTYAPMVELLSYLETNRFSNYVVSGGGRDFIRPVAQELYGIPRERVIGSATALGYVSGEDGGTVSSPMSPARNRPSNEPPRMAGASRASRTTGTRSSSTAVPRGALRWL
jgi:hypothetical protein